MRALGMITACFPHVDEETRNILQSAMDEAKDLLHFSEILCDKVCNETDNPLAIYFAYHFVNSHGRHDLVSRLQDADKFSVLANPLILGFSQARGMLVEWSEYQKAIAEAIKAAPNDWIACHIYITEREGAERRFTESFTDSRVIDVLESKIEEDDDFSFFLGHLYAIRAYRLEKERSMDEAIEMYDQMIIQAEEHDHPRGQLSGLLWKANLVKRIDVAESLDMLEQHRRISEEFGMIGSLSNNLHHSGHIAMARGEYNLALQYQIESNQLGKQMGWPERQLMFSIMMLHNMMGDGAKTLDILTSIQNELLLTNPRWFIQYAWAMVILGNIEDAETQISKAQEIVLKSQDEVLLGLTYLVEGLIHRKKLEFDNAKFTIERALDIFERYLSVAFINVALIHLCDIEIETLSSRSKNIELSGPWMARLLYHVENNDLPGIEAQAKLLKAKFLMKTERIDESNKLVSEVRKISKSQNMEYLDDVAEVLIPKVRK